MDYQILTKNIINKNLNQKKYINDLFSAGIINKNNRKVYLERLSLQEKYLEKYYNYFLENSSDKKLKNKNNLSDINKDFNDFTLNDNTNIKKSYESQKQYHEKIESNIIDYQQYQEETDSETQEYLEDEQYQEEDYETQEHLEDEQHPEDIEQETQEQLEDEQYPEDTEQETQEQLEGEEFQEKVNLENQQHLEDESENIIQHKSKEEELETQKEIENCSDDLVNSILRGD